MRKQRAEPRHREGVELEAIDAALAAVPGVIQVHVWAITSGKNRLTAHLFVETAGEGEHQRVLGAARAMLAERFGITHTTLQVEVGEPCGQDENDHDH